MLLAAVLLDQTTEITVAEIAISLADGGTGDGDGDGDGGKTRLLEIDRRTKQSRLA